MLITSDFEVPQPVERVWEHLRDRWVKNPTTWITDFHLAPSPRAAEVILEVGVDRIRVSVFWRIVAPDNDKPMPIERE